MARSTPSVTSMALACPSILLGSHTDSLKWSRMISALVSMAYLWFSTEPADLALGTLGVELWVRLRLLEDVVEALDWRVVG